MAGVSTRDKLMRVIDRSRDATDELVIWLEDKASSRDGPSGIGKENYTWYQQNVHLVPMTWQDEVRLLRRELERAWSSLKLEEQRNRDLPPLVAVQNSREYDVVAEQAVNRIMSFLEEKEMLTIEKYMKPAMMAHMGSFVPEDKRNFFTITSHYDPAPLFTHFYHWIELARMDINPHPSPVRQGALLYNIFDCKYGERISDRHRNGQAEQRQLPCDDPRRPNGVTGQGRSFFTTHRVSETDLL